jgi:hypothetical protein
MTRVVFAYHANVMSSFIKAHDFTLINGIITMTREVRCTPYGHHETIETKSTQSFYRVTYLPIDNSMPESIDELQGGDLTFLTLITVYHQQNSLKNNPSGFTGMMRYGKKFKYKVYNTFMKC